MSGPAAQVASGPDSVSEAAEGSAVADSAADWETLGRGLDSADRYLSRGEPIPQQGSRRLRAVQLHRGPSLSCSSRGLTESLSLVRPFASLGLRRLRHVLEHLAGQLAVLRVYGDVAHGHDAHQFTVLVEHG